MCIISNEGLIRKIYLPKLIFPLARVLIALVTFVFSLGAMFLLLWPLGARPSWPMLALPVVLALFAVFTLGLSLIVATANTFYRDCGHLISVFLQAWYFLDADPLSGRADAFRIMRSGCFRLNPAYYFIELFHDILFSGRWPRLGLMVDGGRDRGGQPGSRLCHIQVAGRQDGLPTLIGPRRAASRLAVGRVDSPADRAERRLAPVRQLRRQAVLAQAGGARPGPAPRVVRDAGRVLGAARRQPPDRIGRTRRHRRRQRRGQEHAAPPAGADLSADERAGCDPRQRRPADRDGRRVQSGALRARTTSSSTAPCSASRRSEMLAKAAGIYEFTGLREFADMPLKYYSSGMYMRLAFAIATEVHPDILLIDEALGVGDAAFLEKAKARIRGLLERSKAVVLVSHDLKSLRELCTRGLWMQHGRLIADGPIDEVIDEYLAATTAHVAASA